MFYSPLNSTKSFALDLQVPPSDMGYLALINKLRLEPAQTFLHEPIFARLESLCSLAEPARAHGPARLESARDILLRWRPFSKNRLACSTAGGKCPDMRYLGAVGLYRATGIIAIASPCSIKHRSELILASEIFSLLGHKVLKLLPLFHALADNLKNRTILPAPWSSSSTGRKIGVPYIPSHTLVGFRCSHYNLGISKGLPKPRISIIHLLLTHYNYSNPVEFSGCSIYRN